MMKRSEKVKRYLLLDDTFGESVTGWSFEAMLAANRKLGYKSEFDPPVSEKSVKSKKPEATLQWIPRPAEVLAAFDAAWRSST